MRTIGQHLPRDVQKRARSLARLAHESCNPTGMAESRADASERHDTFIRLVFGGDEARYREFCDVIRHGIPADTQVVVRGSAVTGTRWKDGAAFDADGPGTSDLDLTLVGDEAIKLFKVTGFFVPGIHSRPVSEDDPDIAPALTPLRNALIAMVKRPVNIQASRDAVMHFRGGLLGQPYLVLFEKPKESAPETPLV